MSTKSYASKLPRFFKSDVCRSRFPHRQAWCRLYWQMPGGLLMLSFCLLAAAAHATLIGPVFPPPLGVNFSESGTTNDGGIGMSGGKTFSFNNTDLAAYDPVYWGVSNNGVELSFVSSAYSGPGEVMTFSPGQSSLNGGTLMWTGTTVLPSVIYGSVTVNTRCRMVLNQPAVSAASAGLPANVGGVVAVSSAALAWQSTMYFEVQDSLNLLGQGTGAWVPALSFFNAGHTAQGSSSYTSFTAGFWYVNTPPTISNLSPTIYVSPGVTSGLNGFNVNDVETPATLLGVAATSDNQAILPNSDINVGGSGSSRYLTLLTTAGVAGTAHVTVTVTDSDGGSTSQQITVISDTPPTISPIPNQFAQLNSVIGPISFTIGDAETPASSLTLSAASSNPSLVPVANVTFGGSGSNRTVTVTPANDQYGTSTIGVIVSDGLLTTETTFTVTINDRPDLNRNTSLKLNQGAAVTITTNMLYAVDGEYGPSGLIFTIAPGGVGGPPLLGALQKSGVTLTNGSTFTLADVINNAIAYTNYGSCGTNDSFQAGLTNAGGGVWSNNGYSVFNFPINIMLTDAPPIAVNGTVAVGMGGTLSTNLFATDPDCLDSALTFSVVTPPGKGTLTSFNPSNGDFTYVATSGQSGLDTFTFQVSDGTYLAIQAGIETVNIEHLPPVAYPLTLQTYSGAAVAGLGSATDPNLPSPPLTFAVAGNGTKGVAVITNSATGGFIYTPNPGRFGQDVFTYTASDGVSNSAPVAVTAFIQPQYALPGDLLVSDAGVAALFLINTNGDVGLLSSNNFIANPSGVAWESHGTVLVADRNNGLLRINPADGTQIILVSHAQLPYPIGVAVEKTGDILVADIRAGIMRFGGAGNLITNFPPGLLVAPAGLTVDTNGQIFASDAGFFVGNAATNKIVSIDPVSLIQTLITTNLPFLSSPVGLAMEPSGNLLSVQYAGNALVQVSYPGGVQTVVSTNGGLHSPIGVATDPAGDVFVENLSSASILQINPTNGGQTLITAGAPLTVPFGIGVAGTPLPLSIASFDTNGTGSYQLKFTDATATSYSILESTNLLTPVANWTVLGTAVETSPGQYLFTNLPVSKIGDNFYRIRVP